ncbi:MAG: phage baseplate assembly protein V [Pseudomonadota bacterium]
MDEFQLLEDVARRQSTKYWGKYRGHVVDVEDPENRGRIKVTVPSVLGDEPSQWADPAFPYGGGADFGWVAVPPVDSAVLVEFIEGDPSAPIWTGTFWKVAGDVPAEHKDQNTKVLKTETGHRLIFDDTEGEETITLHSAADAVLEMNHEGSMALTGSDGAHVTIDAAAGEIVVEDANGNSITLSSSGIACEDASGNVIETSASGVEVKGTTINIEGQSVTVGGAGGEPLIKGTTFLSLFNSHTHPCTAPGSPSGPPLVPLTPAALTTKTVAS